jgi:hypothetical protein
MQVPGAPLQYRDAVLGPGPHVIRHNLGMTHCVIHVLDDAGNSLPAFIEQTDKDTATVNVGYFSVPAEEWVPGCPLDAVVHMWVHA